MHDVKFIWHYFIAKCKKARKPCLLGRNLTTLFCFVAPVTVVPFQHHVSRCKAKHFLVVQPRFLSSKHSVGETTQLCGRTFFRSRSVIATILTTNNRFRHCHFFSPCLFTMFLLYIHMAKLQAKKRARSNYAQRRLRGDYCAAIFRLYLVPCMCKVKYDKKTS